MDASSRPRPPLDLGTGTDHADGLHQRTNPGSTSRARHQTNPNGAAWRSALADPNLGLSCTTLMGESVGQQIYLGLAGSIWNCPGYEYNPGQTPVPKGNNTCRVVRT